MRLSTQNDILFRLYRLLKFHARTYVAADRRDAVLASALLSALVLLRRGLWSVPNGELSDYARHAIEWHSRRQSNRLARETPELAEEVDDLLERWADEELPIEQQKLERAIEIVYAAQPARRVQIHRMLRQDGLSYLEVARRLGVTIEIVRLEVGLLQRALKKALARTDLLPEAPEAMGLRIAPPALGAHAGGRADRAKWAAQHGRAWQWTPST